MGNFCEQYGLPPIAPSGQKGKKKHDKNCKDYKRYRTSFTKPNKFYDKKKHALKKMTNRNLDDENASIVENLVTLVMIVNKYLVI